MATGGQAGLCARLLDFGRFAFRSNLESLHACNRGVAKDLLAMHLRHHVRVLMQRCRSVAWLGVHAIVQVVYVLVIQLVADAARHHRAIGALLRLHRFLGCDRALLDHHVGAE